MTLYSANQSVKFTIKSHFWWDFLFAPFHLKSIPLKSSAKNGLAGFNSKSKDWLKIWRCEGTFPFTNVIVPVTNVIVPVMMTTIVLFFPHDRKLKKYIPLLLIIYYLYFRLLRRTILTRCQHWISLNNLHTWTTKSSWLSVASKSFHCKYNWTNYFLSADNVMLTIWRQHSILPLERIATKKSRKVFSFKWGERKI